MSINKQRRVRFSPAQELQFISTEPAASCSQCAKTTISDDKTDGSILRRRYFVGDTLRSPQDMVHLQSMKDIYSLKMYEFAWVKRSFGVWTFCQLVGRRHNDKGEDVMTFRVDKVGHRKELRPCHWVKKIRKCSNQVIANSCHKIVEEPTQIPRSSSAPCLGMEPTANEVLQGEDAVAVKCGTEDDTAICVQEFDMEQHMLDLIFERELGSLSIDTTVEESAEPMEIQRKEQQGAVSKYTKPVPDSYDYVSCASYGSSVTCTSNGSSVTSATASCCSDDSSDSSDCDSLSLNLSSIFESTDVISSPRRNGRRRNSAR